MKVTGYLKLKKVPDTHTFSVMRLSTLKINTLVSLTTHLHTVKIHKKMLTHCNKTPQEDKKLKKQPNKLILEIGVVRKKTTWQRIKLQ